MKLQCKLVFSARFSLNSGSGCVRLFVTSLTVIVFNSFLAQSVAFTQGSYSYNPPKSIQSPQHDGLIGGRQYSQQDQWQAHAIQQQDPYLVNYGVPGGHPVASDGQAGSVHGNAGVSTVQKAPADQYVPTGSYTDNSHGSYVPQSQHGSVNGYQTVPNQEDPSVHQTEPQHSDIAATIFAEQGYGGPGHYHPEPQHHHGNHGEHHEPAHHHHKGHHKEVHHGWGWNHHGKEHKEDTLDGFWHLLGPIIFPITLFISSLPFALPVIPAAFFTRLNLTEGGDEG